MELEKIATELAQKAVAARHSDTRLKPGEYPEWAYEFRKLAQPPVRQWAEGEIGKNYVDALFKAVEATRK